MLLDGQCTASAAGPSSVFQSCSSLSCFLVTTRLRNRGSMKDLMILDRKVACFHSDDWLVNCVTRFVLKAEKSQASENLLSQRIGFEGSFAW